MNEPCQDPNRVVALTDVAGRSPFSVLVSEYPVDLHLCSTKDAFQCFPFYTYAEDGTHRRENITDWALEHRVGTRPVHPPKMSKI